MDKRVQIAVFLIACTLITTELGGVQQTGVVCAEEAGEFSSVESLPLQSWLGERFVFLDRRSSDLSPNCRNSCIREFERHPSRYAGRIALVTRVQPKGEERWEIQFEFEDNGERLASRNASRFIVGIALLSDIEHARQRWFGDTVWLKQRYLNTYDAATDTTNRILVGKYTPVEIEDVTTGWYNLVPVRFVLRAEDGRMGFLDLNVSGTNTMWPGDSRFDDHFIECNPQRQRDWPGEVWDAIGLGEIFIGMTVEQVDESWGRPKGTNVTITEQTRRDQWIYDGLVTPTREGKGLLLRTGEGTELLSTRVYLYFDNGTLSTIQRR